MLNRTGTKEEPFSMFIKNSFRIETNWLTHINGYCHSTCS